VDAELKAVLIEKIELSQAELKDQPGLKVKLEKRGQKMSLQGDKKCPPNALLILVERKIRKQRIWKKAESQLARIALADFVHTFERKQTAASSKVELSAARERQLALFPGFESLPTRIRKGNNFLKFTDAPIPEFLAYEAAYQARAQRNQKTAEELRRLAIAVESYAETDLTLAAAFERAKQKIAFMPSVGSR
jgi:hypothetical protein